MAQVLMLAASQAINTLTKLLNLKTTKWQNGFFEHTKKWQLKSVSHNGLLLKIQFRDKVRRYGIQATECIGTDSKASTTQWNAFAMNLAMKRNGGTLKTLYFMVHFSSYFRAFWIMWLGSFFVLSNRLL